MQLQSGADAGPRFARRPCSASPADPRYLALYNMACQRYDAHVKGGKPRTDGKLIAYFSAEYGLTECLPIYSGGLGVLSGDHLKSSSDCDLPLVGVGLLYQQGYFRRC
jgi:glucan phosphorylase